MATFAWGTPVSVKPVDFQEIQDEQLARYLNLNLNRNCSFHNINK